MLLRLFLILIFFIKIVKELTSVANDFWEEKDLFNFLLEQLLL